MSRFSWRRTPNCSSSNAVGLIVFALAAVGASTAQSLARASTPTLVTDAIRLISEQQTLDYFQTPDNPADDEPTVAVTGVGTNASGGYVTRARAFVTFNNTGLAALYGQTFPNVPDPDADPPVTRYGDSDFLVTEINDTILVNASPRPLVGFSSQFGLLDDGGLVYEGTYQTSTFAQRDAIIKNGVALIGEGDQANGQSLDGLSYRGSSADGQIHGFSGFFANEDFGLFRLREDLPGRPVETLLYTGDTLNTGDTILNQDQGITLTNPAFSRSGLNYVTAVDVDPNTVAAEFPIQYALIVNGDVPNSGPGTFFRDDDLIPTSIGGLAGGSEAWDGFSNFAINNSGSWLATADTTAASGSDTVVIMDGQIVLREGVDAPAGARPQGVAINEDGDWAVNYGDTILLNGVPVITGATNGTGTPIQDEARTLARIQTSLAMTERNANNEVTLFFTGRDSLDSLSGAQSDDLYAVVVQIAAALLAGDYNNSGSVEQADLDLVLTNWGTDTTGNIPNGWVNTDDLVGVVDQAELDLVLTNWGSSSAPSFAGSSIPEPAVGMALGLLGWAVLRGKSCETRLRSSGNCLCS